MQNHQRRRHDAVDLWRPSAHPCNSMSQLAAAGNNSSNHAHDYANEDDQTNQHDDFFLTRHGEIMGMFENTGSGTHARTQSHGQLRTCRRVSDTKPPNSSSTPQLYEMYPVNKIDKKRTSIPETKNESERTSQKKCVPQR